MTKKIGLLVGGIVLGCALLLTACCYILWLSTQDYTGISVRNNSEVTLDNVIVMVSGVPYAIGEVKPHQWQSTGMQSRQWRYDMHVIFDVGEKHFDYPAEIHMIPLRMCFISASVDSRLKVSFETKYLKGL